MLLEAMRAEGMVRYGAPFATPSSSWDEVRRAQPALEARSDAQLYQSYRVEYKMRYSHEDMSETLLRHLIDKNGTLRKDCKQQVIKWFGYQEFPQGKEYHNKQFTRIKMAMTSVIH